jgi:hypothetical protein
MKVFRKLKGYYSSDISGEKNQGGLQWAGNVEFREDMRNSYHSKRR